MSENAKAIAAIRRHAAKYENFTADDVVGWCPEWKPQVLYDALRNMTKQGELKRLGRAWYGWNR